MIETWYKFYSMRKGISCTDFNWLQWTGYGQIEWWNKYRNLNSLCLVKFRSVINRNETKGVKRIWLCFHEKNEPLINEARYSCNRIWIEILCCSRRISFTETMHKVNSSKSAYFLLLQRYSGTNGSTLLFPDSLPTFYKRNILFPKSFIFHCHFQTCTPENGKTKKAECFKYNKKTTCQTLRKNDLLIFQLLIHSMK